MKGRGHADDIGGIEILEHGQVLALGGVDADADARIGDDHIRQALPKVPGGPVEVKVTGAPNGEFFSRLEQPRGEVIYYVKGSGKKSLDRFRVRTPTFANIPPLLKMLQGCQFADVATIVLTIDPCISCAER